MQYEGNDDTGCVKRLVPARMVIDEASKGIKKTWLAPSLQAPAVALVALMLQKVYNKKLYFLTVQDSLLETIAKALTHNQHLSPWDTTNG